VENNNIAIEYRWADGRTERLSDLAAELIQLKVGILVAFGDLAVRAAQQKTKTIPIVAMTDDILGAGLIASLARPGGNTTGLTIIAEDSA
jgi:putative ABC transport system substrate-binding protein